MIELKELEPPAPGAAPPPHRVASDVPFFSGLIGLSAIYVLLLLGMLVAMASFTSPPHLWQALQSKEIAYAARLSLLSCTITAILSLWVAVPIGYLMSRFGFWGKAFVDAVLDIPIVLPPLVIGLALLILFQTPPGQFIERMVPGGITFAVPSVILAQFMVAAAFAIRTMRVTFDGIPRRTEQVALTLGCSRSQAFWSVVIPEARQGLLTAGILAWARSLGEFGPILVFAGATRMRTEVLPTSVFLELSIGNIEAAVAVSLMMVVLALVVLVIVRFYGVQRTVM
jgi:molybdate transport system permease protein